MFFSLFIRVSFEKSYINQFITLQKVGQLETVGVVIGVLDAAIDVFLVKYNIVKRVYTNVSSRL